jgi:beta-lactamase regulating signal transducer with metallopeptidase domain
MAGELVSLLLKANLAGSLAILAVLALRPAVASRFGARVAYAMWSIVPVVAAGALMPARRLSIEAAPALSQPASAAAAAPLPALEGPLPPLLVQATIDPTAWLTAVWGLGALVCLALMAAQQVRFGRALGRLTPQGGVFRSDRPDAGPVVAGALAPRIVLPADFEARFTAEEQAFVLAHERAHVRRGDPLVNGVVAALQCLNWFNPLVHRAADRLRLDQELACDAAVIAGRPEARRPYAEAMLKTQLDPLPAPLGCHWPARGLPALKHRIAMLRAPELTHAQRATGFAAIALAGAAAGAGAWAAQPARVETVTAPAGQHSGVTSDKRAELGWALIRAAANDEPAVAEALLKAGADVNFHQPGDGAPLLEAAKRDHVKTMQVLLTYGAAVDLPSPGDGNALIRAAGAGQMRAVQLLLARGADVNAYVPGDETPLINAARSGDLAMVRFLVKRGADPSLAVAAENQPGSPIRSPLSVASDPAVKAYLRANGAKS